MRLQIVITVKVPWRFTRENDVPQLILSGRPLPFTSYILLRSKCSPFVGDVPIQALRAKAGNDTSNPPELGKHGIWKFPVKAHLQKYDVLRIPKESAGQMLITFDLHF
ncbi:hypothetical protein NQ015_07615 [Corynebacterium sp. 153RC1]|uniref:hypothetical protein n=1 Tax=unclassified Corynebacterium TaxID=2624378 RepID=UPI00211BD8AB|nr:MULTISPECIES: hypothetical protein [unclassified Corynebacterium]MCQ9365548.1 hypothetical protein [Corynebacterium sp. 70RC1]MCQ9352791.1 hypothetical protein [Corynebacterium sp. 209RC1]MCQ9354975.1 hypothetical protein [Corynebacterium sp. 1222RC1]MCQ9357236.1 hypothetical protein [Corynebacterium sp. 122RC1]MCQ9359411.1 hypothetical protein [Corynebacterium sp. 142RC1]